MQTGFGAHADEESLEKYAMGTLPDAELARFEEHLLLCEKCQQGVEEMDAFLAAFRNVAPRLRPSGERALRSRWWNWISLPAFPRLAVAGALALLVLAFVIGRTWNSPDGSFAPATVLLQVSRGPEAGGAAQAPAGRPLHLVTDITQLPPSATYGVEIVAVSGARLYFTKAPARDGSLRVPVTRRFETGLYFVRLYSAGGELLREFGLRVR